MVIVIKNYGWNLLKYLFSCCDWLNFRKFNQNSRYVVIASMKGDTVYVINAKSISRKNFIEYVPFAVTIYAVRANEDHVTDLNLHLLNVRLIVVSTGEKCSCDYRPTVLC